MKQKLIINLLLFSSICANAHFDFNFGSQFRSYPMFGGEFYIDTGYNFLLWGSAGSGGGKQGGSVNPFYGFIRPNFGAATSFVVNSYQTELQVFPISILGVVFGQKNLKSDFDFPFFDCEEIICKGESRHTYTTYKLAMGFWRINLVTLFRRNRIDALTASDSDLSIEDNYYGDFRRATAIGPEVDEEENTVNLIGLKFDSFLLGHYYDQSVYLTSEQKSVTNLIIVQKKYGKHEFTVGGGQMESTYLEKSDQIFVFRWKMNYIPSLSLF
ncbi:hypothetical protein N9N67_05225 [Bacteriovoracaceae bacterium]|nr:hypothetical protein [Bacteriovoracaceae bacterium]